MKSKVYDKMSKIIQKMARMKPYPAMVMTVIAAQFIIVCIAIAVLSTIV